MQKCHIQQVIFDVNSLYLRGDMPVKIPPHPLAGQKRKGGVFDMQMSLGDFFFLFVCFFVSPSMEITAS